MLSNSFDSICDGKQSLTSIPSNSKYLCKNPLFRGGSCLYDFANRRRDDGKLSENGAGFHFYYLFRVITLPMNKSYVAIQ